MPMTEMTEATSDLTEHFAALEAQMKDLSKKASDLEPSRRIDVVEALIRSGRDLSDRQAAEQIVQVLDELRERGWP